MLTGSSPKGCSASRQTLARQPMYRLPPHYPFIPVWETDKWFLYTSSLVQCSSWLCSWSTTTQMLSGITLPLRKNLVLFLLMKKWVVLFFHISQGPCGSPVLLFSLFLGTSCPSVFYHVTWHFLPVFCLSALPTDMLMLHWAHPTYVLLVLPLLGLWPSHCPLFPHCWPHHWYCFQHLWCLPLPFLKNSELFHSTDSILLMFDFFVQATDIYWMREIYAS